MFNPTILAAYQFSRRDVQINPIDSCTDVAQFYGLRVSTLARFLIAVGIDTNQLALIA